MEKEVMTIRFGFFLSIILSFLILLNSCNTEKQVEDPFVINGSTMGTYYTVKIVKNDSLFTKEYYESLKNRIDSVLYIVNRQMSTYMEDSEISIFNSFQDTGWFPISYDFAYVVKTALDISAKTDTALDISVGPLVNLWGFGPGKDRLNKLPDSLEIKNLLSLVGIGNLDIRLKPPSIKKAIPEMYIDLSSIAKGFGVDKVSELLTDDNHNNFMVEIGGEVFARGSNHLNSPWKIGISTPNETMGIKKILSIDNFAVATSGDYRNFISIDNKIYSHTIDPRTGWPIRHNLASVTVIHNKCMVADGFATAFEVLGAERSLKLAEKLKLPVYLIVRDDNEFIEYMTQEFTNFVIE
ncbi:MAG: FAD:protein FMN transferase [Melioribacteraceae bacterium]|nr:FAD:protein FMN transferase [Melioribacteraceae bacterium]